MIYYFSGTGNSRVVAGEIARHTADRITDIAATLPYTVAPVKESTGFVFPVYSWGVPPVVLEFIERLPESWIAYMASSDQPLWAVLTYGDEAGNACRMLEKAFARRGLKLRGAWGIEAPNIYVLLPGFDVDSKELEQSKTEKLYLRTAEIGDKIASGRWEFDVYRGAMAFLKTALIYPLFRHCGINPRKWHSTDSCIGCGKCASICPVRNIAMTESGKRKPKWGCNCTSCCACYHVCPTGAVQYGTITKGKGQKKILGK